MRPVTHWIRRNWIAAVILTVIAVGTHWAVQRFHKPGQLDVVAAQAMDMSQMHPPTGVALVDLATVREGSLDDVVTYTGSVAESSGGGWVARHASTMATNTNSVEARKAAPGNSFHSACVLMDAAKIWVNRAGPIRLAIP